MNPNRDDAWELLNEYVKQESLIKHCLSVEAAMRSYARKYGENAANEGEPRLSETEREERWGIVGLLHDFDYEKYPDEHPRKGSEILEEKGYSEGIITAILGHNSKTGVPRKTFMAKTLFAVDELVGMVMATAYVRPSNLEGMTPKSVKKNLKKKGFAANLNRQEIEQGIDELGVDRDNHIAVVIEAMQGISKELGF